MSLIQYQQASYAVHLRDQLERAGCDTQVAALVSRAIGELIDHVAHASCDLRREVEEMNVCEMRSAREVAAFKRDLSDRVVAVIVLLLAVAVVTGVLVALFR